MIELGSYPTENRWFEQQTRVIQYLIRVACGQMDAHLRNIFPNVPSFLLRQLRAIAPTCPARGVADAGRAGCRAAPRKLLRPCRLSAGWTVHKQGKALQLGRGLRSRGC